MFSSSVITGVKIQKSKFETDSQWIMVTLNEVEVCPKFQPDRTSGTGGSGPVLPLHHALQSPYAVRTVRSEQLTPVGWRRPGGNREITLANVLLNHPSMHARR